MGAYRCYRMNWYGDLARKLIRDTFEGIVRLPDKEVAERQSLWLFLFSKLAKTCARGVDWDIRDMRRQAWDKRITIRRSHLGRGTNQSRAFSVVPGLNSFPPDGVHTWPAGAHKKALKILNKIPEVIDEEE